MDQYDVQLRDIRKRLEDSEFSAKYQERTFDLLLKMKDRVSEGLNSLLAEGFQGMNQALGEFKQGINQIVTAISEISEATEEISRSAQEQKNAAFGMNERVVEVGGLAARSHERLEQLDRGVADLQVHSSTLGQLIHDVEDIAETLNVLSINGAIQAARSGDIGKGFAVVTGEMRKLALGVKESAVRQMGAIGTVVNLIAEAGSMSRTVKGDTEASRDSVLSVGQGISGLLGHLDLVASSAEQLAASVHEFSATIEQISRNIDSIDEMMGKISGDFEMIKGFNGNVSAIALTFREIARSSDSFQEAAGRQMKELRRVFAEGSAEESGPIVLARVFLVRPYESLPEDYREEIRRSEGEPNPDARFLCLMGSSGQHTDWNNPRDSRSHKFIRLPEREEDLTVIPMLEKVFSEIGVPYSAIIRPESGSIHDVEGYVLVDDAVASPNIPDKRFLADYGIRSQLSVGGILPSGSMFTMFLFSKEKITRDQAESLRVLGPVLQLCYKAFDDTGAHWSDAAASGQPSLRRDNARIAV